MKSNSQYIAVKELEDLKEKSDLLELLKSKGDRGEKILKTLKYEEELEQLQIELVNLQHWVIENNKRIAIIFEGRDAAGKGGNIRRFIEHLQPRNHRVVALPKPTEEERGQWYFRRYIKQLPNQGEIVFFDRSWYNRAVVEPVNGFCTEEQYDAFMKQLPNFEKMLIDDGLILIKFWLDITKEEQADRFEARRSSPLKQWKISPIDEKAQLLWDDYTEYKEKMFKTTSLDFSPWVVVTTDKKKEARIACIKYVLNAVKYSEEQKKHKLDKNIVDIAKKNSPIKNWTV